MGKTNLETLSQTCSMYFSGCVCYPTMPDCHNSVGEETEVYVLLVKQSLVHFFFK